ncbi:uncharacterized protein LOC131232511 isoform X2 [Magnolia sinica]|uniref:uncharacterized protein LOC131232511 isoform X2 n=1 Tax=Magnolia sinica TaxID=86752 RepID=UPI00265A32F3|nr:uncharacterized protein LOC131232511 isoform X2 [Magnolia sinica]
MTYGTRSKVEYKEDYLGQTLHATAEAPKEALPLDCRPGFGTAWLTKHKFKVNETYNCRYTPGISKVEIYPDSLFNCKAKDPSMLEMMRRFFILFLKSMNSFFSNTSDTLRAKSMLQGAVAGVVSGVLVASVFVILLKLLMDLKLRLARKWGARSLRITVYAARFRRACIIVAYFSAMGWLAVQYGKMVGFSDLFISPHLVKKTAKRLLGHLSALLDFFLPFLPIVGHQFML